MSEEMRSRLWGILKALEKRAIPPWLGSGTVIVVASLWTVVTFVVEYKDVHIEAIAKGLTIVFWSAAAAYYAAYYLVLRSSLVMMREAIDKVSSVSIGNTTAGADAAARIQGARRLARLALWASSSVIVF